MTTVVSLSIGIECRWWRNLLISCWRQWQLLCRSTFNLHHATHELSLIRKPPLVAVFLFNKHKCIVSIHWTPCLFFNFGRIQAKYHHQFLLSFLPFFLVCLKPHGNHRIAHKLTLLDTSPHLSTTPNLSCSAMYS